MNSDFNSKFYKSDVVNQADVVNDAGDDDDAVEAMEGALVVGLVVWKCQCSMHEQQHFKCSNISHNLFNIFSDRNSNISYKRLKQCQCSMHEQQHSKCSNISLP